MKDFRNLRVWEGAHQLTRFIGRLPGFQETSGSASELDYHLLLARDLGFLHRDVYDQHPQELPRLRRMLTLAEGRNRKQHGEVPNAKR